MRYRKKPIVVEAYQLPAAGEDVPDSFEQWCEEVNFHGFVSDRDEGMIVETTQGPIRADPGDWIIKGVTGEFYPCKPDAFAATYDKVEGSYWWCGACQRQVHPMHVTASESHDFRVGGCGYPVIWKSGTSAEHQPLTAMDADDWAELHRLRAEAKGPDGYATWKEAALAERNRRVEAERQLSERQPASAPTRMQIGTIALTLCKLHAEAWGRDEEDEWALHCKMFRKNARVIFRALRAAKRRRPNRARGKKPIEAQIEAGVKALRERWQQSGDGLSDHSYVECVLRAALATKESAQ